MSLWRRTHPDNLAFLKVQFDGEKFDADIAQRLVVDGSAGRFLLGSIFGTVGRLTGVKTQPAGSAPSLAAESAPEAALFAASV